MQPSAQAADAENNTTRSTAAASVLRQSKREDLLAKCTLLLRVVCLLFSFISFVVMAANKLDGRLSFDRFQEYQLCHLRRYM